MQYVYVNNQCVPSEDAVIPADNRGFRFGDGVFETIALHNGHPYQWDTHMQRLQDGLRTLRIPAPTQDLLGAARTLIARNNMQQGILRISVARGGASQGYKPTDTQAAPTVVIHTMPAAPAPSSLALLLSECRKPPTTALPSRHKTAAGGLNSTLALLEAEAQQCDQPLQLSTAGFISELASANIFWRIGSRLYTPSLSCDCLQGTTRAAIMRLGPYPIEEAEALPSVLQDADAVIACNSSWPIAPISTLKPLGWQWHSQTLADELSQLIMQDRDEQCRG